MADARKRARRDLVAAASLPPAAPVEPGASEPSAAGAETVFADEPAVPGPASPSSSAVSLPASGLAEDILKQLEPRPVIPRNAAASGDEGSAVAADAPPEPAAPRRIELPASGLAEDILGRPGDATAAPSRAPLPVSQAQPSVPGAHSLSFFAAPAQEQRAAVEATEHLVTFFLDREEYGMDVRQVQEIRRLTEITSVPRTPEFIRGVINLRGRILPVLDLKRKLGLGEVAESRAARIVVVRVRDRLIGLLVDGASQVPKIPVSRIEAPPEEVVERGGDYIRGVAKLDDRLIILVDLERLLAHELKAQASPAATGRATVGQDGVS
jgi:purine-binding chemotaxis protein CheW